MLWPLASSPRLAPVVASPAGTSQVKVAKAAPTPEVAPGTAVHRDGTLQLAPPALVVSQT